MFPGAVADREEASFAIVGAPLDASTSFQPGTRFGPRELRHAAHPFEDYDQSTDSHFTDCAVYDHGDVNPTDDTSEYLDFLTGALSEFDDEGLTPLVLGGEHTVTIAALRSIDPDIYVCLDAHLDLRESYAGNSLSHATVTHHALDIAEEVIILGARSGSKSEWNRAEGEDVTVVEPEEVPSWELDRSGDVYLSVDIDAADPGFAPGTGTPEPFGLEPRAMRDVVRDVASQAIGCDIVEVNDRDNGQAAALGAKLLRSFVYANR